MNVRINAVIALIAVLLFSPARSAEETGAPPLTLESAVRLAMAHNSDLQTARLEVDRADARVLEAWGNALPAADLSANYVHLIDKPVTFFPDYFLYGFLKDVQPNLPKPTGQLIAVSFAPGFSADAGITVRQILFNGAVIVGVGAAHVYSELSRDMYQAKAIETVNKVRKSYYGALLAHEALKLMRSSLQNAEDNLRNVTLMRRQGIVSEYDELRASVGVDNLRPVVLQSENNYNLALDALRNSMGVTGEMPFALADSLVFIPVDDSLLANAEEFTMSRNPALSMVDRQMELNSAMTFAERSSYLPTIAAFGGYSYSSAKNEFNFSRADFYKSSQIGLTLQLNLFQGMQTYARVEQAQVEERKTEEQKLSLERSLRTGVHSVVGNLRQARKRVEAQTKTVETAERGYRIVTTRFLSNAATQLEVNDAQLALTQAQVNRIQAVYDYLVAAADLDQLIGVLPDYATETSKGRP